MVAVSLFTMSSKGLDETTLNLRTLTSIAGISLPPTSLIKQLWREDPPNLALRLTWGAQRVRERTR